MMDVDKADTSFQEQKRSANSRSPKGQMPKVTLMEFGGKIGVLHDKPPVE